MGRSLFNLIGSSVSNFEHKIEKTTRSAFKSIEDETTKIIHKVGEEVENIGKPNEDGLVNFDPISQTVDIFRSRGTKRGSIMGRRISKYAGILESIGEYTGIPVFTGIGAGLDTIGKFEQGDNIGGIVGGVAGDIVAGSSGGLITEKIGEQVGKKVGGLLGSENRYEEPTDRTHNDQLGKQIRENKHFEDKEEHHSDFQHQGDLTAGVNSGNVGNGLLNTNINRLTNDINSNMDNQILQLKNVNDALRFISQNVSSINNLPLQDENRVFDELIATGLFNSVLA